MSDKGHEALQSPQKPRLQKSFNLLKSHACKVANFTLLWQDLEDHFRFIQSQIDSLLLQHHTTAAAAGGKPVEDHDNGNNKENPLNGKHPPTQLHVLSGYDDDDDLVVEIENDNDGDNNEAETSTAVPVKNEKEDKSKTKNNSRNRPNRPYVGVEDGDKTVTRKRAIEVPVENEKEDDSNNSRNGQNPPTQLPVSSGYVCQDVGIEDGDRTSTRTRRRAIEVPVKNGKELMMYIKERVIGRRGFREAACCVLEVVDDPVEMVLEALKEFDLAAGYADFETSKSCMVLLEELARLRTRRVEGKIREEAMRLAVEYRDKIRAYNDRDVMGFLKILVAFRLEGEFNSDEILKLFNKVVTRKEAPEWLRGLGLAHKAYEIIQNLIKEKRRVEAVRYIFAFELFNEFPPIPLLKVEISNAQKISMKYRRDGPNPLKAQNDATSREIGTLRSIIKVLVEFQLGSEIPPSDLRNRIKQLEMERNKRNCAAKTEGSNAQSQQQNGNKRTASAPDAQQNKNKQPRTSISNASAGNAPTMNSKLPSYHQQESVCKAQGGQYSALSANMGAHPIAAPYSAVGGTSETDPMHPSLSQLVGLFAGLQQLNPSLGYNQLAGSAPFSPHLSSSAGAFGLAASSSSSSLYLRSTSHAPYGLSDAENGIRSPAQFGVAGTLAPMGVASVPSINGPVPFNLGHLLRASQYYDGQTSSGTVGIPANASSGTSAGYYDRPAFSHH